MSDTFNFHYMPKKSSKQRKKEKLQKRGFKRRGKVMPQRNIASRNHYVSKWYQKRFIVDNGERYFYLKRTKGSILLANGHANIIENVHFLPPKKCFYRHNLYTVDLIGTRDDAIEKQLFGRIDNLGSQSFDTIIQESGWCTEKGDEKWQSFVEFMDAQRLRTPRGLDWIKQALMLWSKSSVFFYVDQDTVLVCMQQIRQIHSTMWTEAIWEVVSAEHSNIKFIVSDNPVTTYNNACPPNSLYCRYPLQPQISLIGTRTIFPLDLDHCLILTNRQCALDPDNINPLEERINARYFGKTIFNFLDVIRERSFQDKEVAQINYIIKALSSQCVAAGRKEWLYPENILGQIEWKEIDKLLRPPRDKVVDTQSIFISHRNGSTEAYDPYGQEIKDPKELESIKKGNLIIKKHLRKEKFSEEVIDLLNEHDNPNLQQQNNMLLDGISYIFGLTDGKTYDDLRRQISDDEIRTFYRLIEDIWPVGLDTIRNLPKPDESFTILYSGEMDADSVFNYLLGCSLYVDKILVVNPFPNPCCIKDDHNPIRHPSQYKVATYRLLFILGMLEPCIRSGMIQIIPNPFNVDFRFREIMFEQVEKRKKSLKIGKRETDFMIRKTHNEIFWTYPESYLRKTLKEIKPNISNEEIEQTIKYHKQLKELNPSQYLQSLDKTGPQLMLQHYGLNLEVLSYLCYMTGSVPYTYINLKQKELSTISRTLDTSPKWETLSNCFSKIQFRFLNLALAPLIVEMHDKGLFESFRSFMRKIKKARFENATECPEGLVDLLEVEYKQLEKDYNVIETGMKHMLGDKFLEKAGGAYFYGNLVPYFDELSLECIAEHLTSNFGKEHVLERIPMSIYGRLSVLS